MITVEIYSYGNQKIKFIKALRKAIDLTLKEAVNFVNSLPNTVEIPEWHTAKVLLDDIKLLEGDAALGQCSQNADIVMMLDLLLQKPESLSVCEILKTVGFSGEVDDGVLRVKLKKLLKGGV